MISDRRRSASSTIAWPMLRVRTMRVITSTPYWRPSAAASRSCTSASAVCASIGADSGLASGTSIGYMHDQARARLGGQLERGRRHLVVHPVGRRSASGSTGTRPRRPARSPTAAPARSRSAAAPGCGGRRRRRPCPTASQPTPTDRRRLCCSAIVTRNEMPGPQTADDGEGGHVEVTPPEGRRPAPGHLPVGHRSAASGSPPRAPA